MKKCFKCKKSKKLSAFYKHTSMSDGYLGKCKECAKQDVCINYLKKKDYYRKYDRDRQKKNIFRIINHRYSGIKQRIMGRAIRAYNVKGKEICSYEDFRKWALSDENLKKLKYLMKEWENSGYSNRFAPSIDRIDNNKGYEIENIRWIPKKENSSKYTKLLWK